MDHIGALARSSGAPGRGSFTPGAGCWAAKPGTGFNGKTVPGTESNLKYLHSSSMMHLRQVEREAAERIADRNLSKATLRSSESEGPRVVLSGERLSDPALALEQDRPSTNPNGRRSSSLKTLLRSDSWTAQSAVLVSSTSSSSLLNWGGRKALSAETRSESVGSLRSPSSRSRRAPVPILLPDKIDWIHLTLQRGPEYKELTQSELGKPMVGSTSSSSIGSAVPAVDGPTAMFLPEGSLLGTEATTRAMDRSRSEQRMRFVAAPSSIATGASRARQRSLSSYGSGDRWSLYSFDRIAEHNGTG